MSHTGCSRCSTSCASPHTCRRSIGWRLISTALVDLELIDLAGAWRLVSTNAADAVGLTDRGRIAPGQRADLLLVDWQSGRLPRLAATFVEGEALFAADNPLRMTA